MKLDKTIEVSLYFHRKNDIVDFGYNSWFGLFYDQFRIISRSFPNNNKWIGLNGSTYGGIQIYKPYNKMNKIRKARSDKSKDRISNEYIEKYFKELKLGKVMESIKHDNSEVCIFLYESSIKSNIPDILIKYDKNMNIVKFENWI